MSIKPRDDFFVTLPSNVPGHPENTPSNYTTTLPTPLELAGSWEVALLETHYFKHWSLVKELKKEPKRPKKFPKTHLTIFAKQIEGNRISYEREVQHLTDVDGSQQNPGASANVKLRNDPWNLRDRVHEPHGAEKPTAGDNSWFSTSASLQNYNKPQWGFYHGFLTIENERFENILTLAQEIVKNYPDMKMSVIDDHSGKLMFYSEGHYLYFLCPDTYLLDRLGYDWFKKTYDNKEFYIARMDREGDNKATLDEVTEEEPEIETPKVEDDKANELQSIFVYSDIVDYQIVGNTMATLMGVLPTKGMFKEPQSWQFNPLQYLPIQSNNISTITMKLCTPQGDPVQFLSGDSLCRLHFRRKLL